MGAEEIVQALVEHGVLIRSLAAHHATRGLVRVTVGDAQQNARCVSAFERVVGRVQRPQPPAQLTLPDAE